MLGAWRLSSGPISLAFLSPYIEKALSAEDGSFAVRFDDTILTWAGWDRTVDMRVLNARLLGADGTAVAVVPEMSVSVSAQALLNGSLAPRTVEVYRPSLQIVRRADGSFGIGFGGEETSGGDGTAGRILSQFAGEPDETGSMGYLRRIGIHQADLVVIDQELGTSWNAPNAEVKLVRGDDGIDADLSFDLGMPGDRQAHIAMLGSYLRETGRTDLGVEFSGVVPAAFAELSTKLTELAGIDVPVEGNLAVSLDRTGTVSAVDFDVLSGAGTFDLPAPLSQTLAVESIAAEGHFEGGTGDIELERLTLELGENGELVLPAADGHRLPVHSIEAEATVRTRTGGVALHGLEADLGGPTLSAHGALAVDGETQTLTAEAVLRNVPADDVGRYWPRAWGDDPHDWVTKNLSHGMVVEARAETELTSTGGGSFQIVKLEGDMVLDDFTVDYLKPMPKATHVSGTATFTPTTFTIDVEEGQVPGLELQTGKLVFIGLDKPDQDLDLDLTIHGDVPSALKLIDSRPLGLASKIGIDPAASTGRASTRIRLRFPLIDELTFAMVKVSAAARMADVTVQNAIMGRGITNGNLELKADNDGMMVTGTMNLGTIPGTLEWHESFDSKEPVRTTYVLRGLVDDTQRTEELGFDFAPFSTDHLHGPVGAEVQWNVLRSGQGKMRALLDMSQAEMMFPQLGWSKPPGVAGTAEVEVALDGDTVTGVPLFSVRAGDLSTRGSVATDPKTGDLRRVDLDQLVFGRSDVRGALIPGRDGGWTVTVHGPSFDFAPMFGNMFSLEGSSDDAAADTAPPGPDISFSVDLDRLWVSQDQAIQGVKGTLVRTAGRWRAVKVSGQVGDGKALNVVIEPGPDGGRLLNIDGEDAGATLRTLGYYDNMAGGTLKISGIFEDRIEGSPLRGRVSVRDFRIVRAPTLAKLVGIVSLTGIVDALQGPGLGFSEMEVPFTRNGGVLTLTDARVTGASLGLTAEGKVYSSAEVIDMQGTLVPAYAINSALGNIPLLGALFSGGEKGGGVFAATYKVTGPVESPEITVNPLSVLAPGFIRRLFGIFDEAPEGTTKSPDVPSGPIDIE